MLEIIMDIVQKMCIRDRSFLHAIFRPGAEMILEETGLEKELQGADFLVTGEGKLDEQTAMGKAPARAAALAKKYGVKTIALAGGVAVSYTHLDTLFPDSGNSVCKVYRVSGIPVRRKL